MALVCAVEADGIDVVDADGVVVDVVVAANRGDDDGEDGGDGYYDEGTGCDAAADDDVCVLAM